MVLSKKYTNKFLEMPLYTPPLKFSKIRFKGGYIETNGRIPFQNGKKSSQKHGKVDQIKNLIRENCLFFGISKLKWPVQFGHTKFLAGNRN